MRRRRPSRTLRPPRISPLLARATTPRSAVRPARTGARAVRLAVTGVLLAMRRVPLIGARPRRPLSALTGVPLLPPPTKVGRLRGNTLGFLSCHPTSRECVGGQEGESRGIKSVVLSCSCVLARGWASLAA